MPGKHSRRLVPQCIYASEDNESDDDNDNIGYHRLEPVEGVKTPMTQEVINLEVVDSCQQPSHGEEPSPKKSDVNTDVDAKGKRLRKKLRRKKVRKRIGHVLHTTWKWVKRGAVATGPNLAAMFMFAPATTFTLFQRRP